MATPIKYTSSKTDWIPGSKAQILWRWLYCAPSHPRECDTAVFLGSHATNCFAPIGSATKLLRYVTRQCEHSFAKAHVTGDTPANADLHILPELAAAGLWTTPSDLLQCIKSVEESLHSDAFLEQKWAKMMLTEVNVMARGWRVQNNVFHHTGPNEPGYECIADGFADGGELLATGNKSSAGCRELWV